MGSNLVVFNRCEILADGVSVPSVVGPNFQVLGSPTSVPGKFGNAIKALTTYDGIKTLGTLFPAAKTNNWTRFTIEFFINSNNAISGGIPATGNGFNTLFTARDNVDSGTMITLDFQVNGNFCQVNSGSYFLNTNAGLNLLAGRTYHYAWVCNLKGINKTTDTMRVYLNNVLCGSSTITWTAYTGDTYLRFLNDYNHTYAFQGWGDNLKIWNYDKTDFKDSMNKERAGMNDVI